MAAELGAARISVGLDTSKVAGEIKKAFSGVDAAGDAAGKSAGGGFASGFKGLVGPAVAAIGAIGFGGLIAEAARASDATDKFKATMNFAGLDTSAIDAATAAAKEFADQTVYDLPTIQNTIAQLASNGVKDYTGLTKAAGNLNAVAGGNADTFKSVAMVMTQTAGAGKLTTENWNQMADAIPGAAGPLMKSLEEAGAYTGNFRDAMAAGDITADEFNDALMKLGNDPVAVEAAKSTATFEGAIGNLEATINSGLMSALNALKPAITGAMNLLSNGLGAAFEWTGNAVTGLSDLLVRGDFSGKFREAFHVDEDSGLVNFLFNVRDAVIQLWSGLSMGGDVRAQFAGQLSGFVEFGADVRAALDGVRQSVSDFWAGLSMDSGTRDQFAGQLEGFVEIGAKVRGAFSDLWAGLTMPADVAAGIGAPLEGMVGIGASLRQTFDTVVAGFQPLFPVFAALVPQLFQLFQALSPTSLIFQALVPVLPQIAAAVMGVVQAVLPLVLSLTSQLLPIVTQLVASVLPPLISIFSDVVSAIAPLITQIAGLLVPVIQALMPVVVTVFSVVADVIKSAMTIVQGIIQVVTGIIKGDWSQVWTGIQNIFKGIWDTIVNVVRGALQIVGQVVISGLGMVGNFVGSTLANIGRFFSDAWGNITRGIGGFIDGAIGFFRDLPGKIMGALAGAGGWLLDVGRNIVQGLIDGIGSMMGSIGRAILSIVPEAIRGPFEAALGIHSPSRVFREYGVNIGQGLVLGIDGMHGKVADSVSGLVSVPAAPRFSSPAYAPAGSSFGSGAGQTFNTTINQVDDPIGTAHAVTRRLSSLIV